MKFQLPSSVTRTVARQLLVAQKNSPTILFVGGVAGVVATTVLACRATLRVEDEVLTPAQTMLETARTHQSPTYSEGDRRHDITLIYVKSAAKFCKLYGPSIVLGAVSIGMLTKSHNILTTRNAGLTAAYAALDKGFKDYRKRVVNEYGEEKDREFRFGTDERTIVTEDKNGPKKQIVKTAGDGGGSIYSKLFEDGNVNWDVRPEYNVIFLRGMQHRANDRLRAKGHLFLNDVYRDLGFDDTPAGSQVGWLYNGDGDGYVDFGIWDDASMERFHDFLIGREGAIWLDFNVDGPIWDRI